MVTKPTISVRRQWALPPHIQAGAEFRSRTGAAYVVVSVDPKGFVIGRTSGKTCRISLALINKVRSRVMAGEALHPQASARGGGISYTVAVTAGVAYALQGVMRYDAETHRYVLGGQS